MKNKLQISYTWSKITWVAVSMHLYVWSRTELLCYILALTWINIQYTSKVWVKWNENTFILVQKLFWNLWIVFSLYTRYFAVFFKYNTVKSNFPKGLFFLKGKAFQAATIVRTEPDWSKGFKLHPGLLYGQQGPKHLNRLLLLSRVCWQGTRSEAEQPAHSQDAGPQEAT